MKSYYDKHCHNVHALAVHQLCKTKEKCLEIRLMLLKYLNNLHYNDVGTRKKHLFYNVTEFICQQDKCCEHKQGYIKGTVYLFVYQSTTMLTDVLYMHNGG